MDPILPLILVCLHPSITSLHQQQGDESEDDQVYSVLVAQQTLTTREMKDENYFCTDLTMDYHESMVDCSSDTYHTWRASKISTVICIQSVGVKLVL